MQVFRPTPIDHEQAEKMREVVEKSRELLSQPPPDTFIGRRTREPFPSEDEELGRSINTPGLKPPE